MTQLPGTKWLSLDPELNKITVQADRGKKGNQAQTGIRRYEGMT